MMHLFRGQTEQLMEVLDIQGLLKIYYTKENKNFGPLKRLKIIKKIEIKLTITGTTKAIIIVGNIITLTPQIDVSKEEIEINSPEGTKIRHKKMIETIETNLQKDMEIQTKGEIKDMIETADITIKVSAINKKREVKYRKKIKKDNSNIENSKKIIGCFIYRI